MNVYKRLEWVRNQRWILIEDRAFIQDTEFYHLSEAYDIIEDLLLEMILGMASWE